MVARPSFHASSWAVQLRRSTALPGLRLQTPLFDKSGMPHLAGRLLELLAFVSTIRSMVFHASAGGYALPGGRVKNWAALLSPEPETQSRSLKKAAPLTVADQTGRCPPTTLRPPPAV